MRTFSIRKGNDRLLNERRTGIPKALRKIVGSVCTALPTLFGASAHGYGLYPSHHALLVPTLWGSCSIRKLFLTVCEIENGVTMTPKRRSTDFICVIFYLFFDNEKTCLNNRSPNGIQRPFLSPTPTMVYTKETTTHSNRIIHTQLFAKYLFIYNLVPRYGLGINLHVWILANQNQNNYC